MPALILQSDNYLLIKNEFWLLMLDEAKELAPKMGYQQVVEILAAHTKRS